MLWFDPQVEQASQLSFPLSEEGVSSSTESGGLHDTPYLFCTSGVSSTCSHLATHKSDQRSG